MINIVCLTGRLCKDPELKVTPSGVNVSINSIAVQRFSRAKDDKGDQITDFVPVVAWSKTAEFLKNYFHKGDMVGITGRIQTSEYTDKDGTKRRKMEIVVDQIHFVESKKQSNNNITADDDLPF